ncbi:pseudouridine synthase [Flectobacillus sp. DC10W]|uniref:Pseudouridine synthase n=2 Tax=Bacteroidota TaxID=976 RepID=A0ABT6YPJ3_9BACT|nr:pseudouridine synthase [Flectobacillus longus]MDI9865485.1 pseudouridine synthase [Flectobacillus longus]
MRKRIQKEEFSPERREQSRTRREELKRELRGEAPAKNERYSDKKSFDSNESRPARKDFKPNFEKKDFNRDDSRPRREGGFNGEKREFRPKFEDKGRGFEKRDFNRDDSRGPRREGGFNGEKREFRPKFEDKGRGFEKRDFNRDDSRGPRREGGFNGEKREFRPKFEDKGRGFEKRDFNRDDSRGPRREGGFNGEKREFRPKFEDKGRGFEKRDFNREDSRPRREGGFDGEKREFRPRFEDKGRGFEKRDFNREDSRLRREGGFDGEKREFRPRFEDKGRGFEKRDFNREDSRPRREGGFDGEKREFRPRFDKDAPRSERREEGSERKPRTERSEKTYGSAKANFGGKKNLFKAHRPQEESDKWTPTYRLDKYKETASKKVQKQIEKSESSSSLVRLNRYIANAGVCSRREADDLIKAGEIKINGKVVTEMGYQVKHGDIVKYGNRKLSREKMVYLLLNKPKDFITTTEDPNERKTVMDLVSNACQERIYPVGRLDRNTTGLLLLTNDGELADKLTHPSNEITKVYQVELDKPLTTEHFDAILKGVTLEDGEIKADELAIVTPDNMVVGIQIHSGRNRIVRRIFESLGYEVLKLDRTTFATLSKKDLPRGTWRFLTEQEVIKLKYFV